MTACSARAAEYKRERDDYKHRLKKSERGLSEAPRMAVTFILGRAGTGKTHQCVQAILAELGRAQETRRLIFLVPEQASFQMERALALGAPGGGYTRAEVLSFSRLARRVFAQTGLEPRIIGGAAPQSRPAASWWRRSARSSGRCGRPARPLGSSPNWTS